MKLFNLIASKLPQFNKLQQNLTTGVSTLVVGLSNVHKAHFAASLAFALNKSTLIITPDEATAKTICSDISQMVDIKTLLYPVRDFTLRAVDAVSLEYEQIRLNVLDNLISGDICIVVASIEAVLQHTVPPDVLKQCTFSIEKSKSYNLDKLSQSLSNAAYTKVALVEGVSQYSIRGGILDVFPPSYTDPIRIEFFGDCIETMSFFDIVSQRRTESISKIEIIPATENIIVDKESLIDKLKVIYNTNKCKNETIKNDIERLQNNVEITNIDKYKNLLFEKTATLLTYFTDNLTFICEYAAIKENYKSISWQLNEDIKILIEQGEFITQYFEEMPYLLKYLKNNTVAYFDTFARTNTDVRFHDLITITPIQTSSWSGDVRLLCEDIKPLIEAGYCVCVMGGTAKATKALELDLKKEGINVSDGGALSYKRVHLTNGSLHSGFEYTEIKLCLITVVNVAAQTTRKERYQRGKLIKSLTDLSVGDYVVHISHGIGIFDGIKRLDLQGVIKDYIKISYAGSDTLYVPVTQLDLVSKYTAPRDDGKVKLNKLNTTTWAATKSRVKKAIDDIADELILLYSKRMSEQGFAFSKDTPWQAEFEEKFPFRETDDQLRCSTEIKTDMERAAPMDRVLCGDVGFGKTEVAVRAAFKAVMDNKQVALLCPTTILAWQHFKSLTTRFSSFPMKIELLSRFRTPKEQKVIIKQLKTGEVDIVIGTHRLVQKDIIFKDLGLAIIDEEQRFGVKHKEKFKSSFPTVDVLTLSATPIPRTLNMAMSGIRDLSTIEQAPQDRHPIQSYVLEQDMGVIGEAIKKELRRGGQVYYIYNRIETIDLCATRIQAVVPEARIGIAHGRLDEKDLSEMWRKLLEREIDILLCTTIIETGVDVANCNTLIVEDSDRMGLSQLYQLRGRIGRSNRRAFAYFTFKRGKVLTEIATKRLNAIREFTKFGSGFRIAMRDMEIRGAGNILGAKQHGHLEAVGYDMYLKMLGDAVAARKGEIPKKTVECLIDIRVNAYIPQDYIEDLSSRIDVYKKISSIQSVEDSIDVTEELIDRFGALPDACLSLIDVALLRNSLSQMGFCEVNEKPSGVYLYLEVLNMDIASKIMTLFPKRAMLNVSDKPYIKINNKGLSVIDILRTIAGAISQ